MITVTDNPFKEVKISTLRAGDCFYMDSALYMLIRSSSGIVKDAFATMSGDSELPTSPCVCLTSGYLIFPNESQRVIPVNLKAEIELQ